MDTWADLAKTLLTAAIAGGGIGAIVAWAKERRFNQAKGDVAVQTVELQVDHTRMQNLEVRFALAERAWDEERESLVRRVTAAEARESALEAELAKKEAKITLLEERVTRVQQELLEVTRELADLRSDR
ncbi:hypothetical protein C5C07_20350 [Haloferax sp. Atlit-4N]|uniref:hypothetical protein n=1 Tax=Haloferax sp. Atlit-4N TaxID=2077206 RepID=UPI000E283A85|nr:hypothetical protein [Haloferax sp. Atlit-4N]RDZ49322.1 hypothetical protein C5C07_20350 [Haloferax sp. Atlit-4N]